jgi:hypothetical protein
MKISRPNIQRQIAKERNVKGRKKEWTKDINLKCEILEKN